MGLPSVLRVGGAGFEGKLKCESPERCRPSLGKRSWLPRNSKCDRRRSRWVLSWRLLAPVAVIELKLNGASSAWRVARWVVLTMLPPPSALPSLVIVETTEPLVMTSSPGAIRHHFEEALVLLAVGHRSDLGRDPTLAAFGRAQITWFSSDRYRHPETRQGERALFFSERMAVFPTTGVKLLLAGSVSTEEAGSKGSGNTPAPSL